VKYWKIIANNLIKAGSSWGCCVSAIRKSAVRDIRKVTQT
jgi:hypothetical protein